MQSPSRQSGNMVRRPTRSVRSAMTTSELLAFMREQRLAVQASAGPGNTVQAALVGIAVTDSFELVFDTLDTTRKAQNLRRAPSVGFVLGGWHAGDERTVQYEGIADQPAGDDLDRLKAAYFHVWPDGRARQSWPGLIYIRARPTWIRYSEFNRNPPTIVEFTARELGAPPAKQC
ncbi:MAG TPA: pyridoxamine 5'-phosphate oxidase family protein [Gemmatimonadales bacterium]|nr:pyridoxamine 5'-phosphate oxidase family protein [Gemmatimonadales bacterium]